MLIGPEKATLLWEWSFCFMSKIIVGSVKVEQNKKP